MSAGDSITARFVPAPHIRRLIQRRLWDLCNGADPEAQTMGICHDVSRYVDNRIFGDKDERHGGGCATEFLSTRVERFMIDVFTCMGFEPNERGRATTPLGSEEFFAEGSLWQDYHAGYLSGVVRGRLDLPTRGSDRRTLAGLAAAYLEGASIRMGDPQVALEPL